MGSGPGQIQVQGALGETGAGWGPPERACPRPVPEPTPLDSLTDLQPSTQWPHTLCSNQIGPAPPLPMQARAQAEEPATGTAPHTSAPLSALSRSHTRTHPGTRARTLALPGHSSPLQVQPTSFSLTSTTQPQPPHTISMQGMGIFPDPDSSNPPQLRPSTPVPLPQPELSLLPCPLAPAPTLAHPTPWHAHGACAAETGAMECSMGHAVPAPWASPSCARWGPQGNCTLWQQVTECTMRSGKLGSPSCAQGARGV